MIYAAIIGFIGFVAICLEHYGIAAGSFFVAAAVFTHWYWWGRHSGTR